MKHLVLIAFVFATICLPVLGQDSLNVSTQAVIPMEFWGEIHALETSGPHVFAATNGTETLSVYDFSDPANPTRIGGLTIANTILTNILIRDTVLYATSADRDLYIINIADHAHPTTCSVLHCPIDISFDLVRVNQFLITAGNNCLAVFYIPDAFHPTLVNTIDTFGTPRAIEIVGDYAFIADGEAGLAIMNLDGLPFPESPEPFVIEGIAVDLAHFENRLYLLHRFIGIKLLDISNPDVPVELCRYDPFPPNSGASDVIAHGGKVYAVNEDEIYLLDMEDAENPEVITTTITAPVFSIKIIDPYIYIGSDGMLQCWNYSNPSTPEIASNVTRGLQINGLCFEEDVAYVKGQPGMFYTVDASSPDTFEPLAMCVDPGAGNDVTVGNNYACVTGNIESGFQSYGLIDVINDNHPSMVYEFTLPGQHRSFHFDGSALCVCTSDQVTVFETNAQDTPAILQSISPDPGCEFADALLCGARLYVAQRGQARADNELRIYDVSEDLAPELRSTMAQMRMDRISLYRETLVYYADQTAYPAELGIVDISNSNMPRELAHKALSNTATSVLFKAGRCILTTRNNTIMIYNCTNPSWISSVGQFRARCGIVTTGMKENSLYVIREEDILVLDISDAMSEVDVEEITNTLTPQQFTLHPLYPNPFNPVALSTVEVPEAGQAHIALYNCLGQQVMELYKGWLASGRHTLQVNAEGLPSGIYYLKASMANGSSAVQRAVLIK